MLFHSLNIVAGMQPLKTALSTETDSSKIPSAHNSELSTNSEF